MLFDSILLNSLQLESQSDEALLNCTVFEGGESYTTEVVLSSTALNQLLNELASRDLEPDFDRFWEEIRLPDSTCVYRLELDVPGRNPLFLPLYVLPERIRLLRA